MEFEIVYSKYVNELAPDHWKGTTIKADTEKEAIDKLTSKENNINYILECTRIF